MEQARRPHPSRSTSGLPNYRNSSAVVSSSSNSNNNNSNNSCSNSSMPNVAARSARLIPAWIPATACRPWTFATAIRRQIRETRETVVVVVAYRQTTTVTSCRQQNIFAAILATTASWWIRASCWARHRRISGIRATMDTWSNSILECRAAAIRAWQRCRMLRVRTTTDRHRRTHG